MQQVGTQIGPMIACSSDLESVRDGIIAYRDKNGKYPAAETWMADIRPLLQANPEMKQLENNPVMSVKPMDRTKAFRCQATPEKAYGFAYNSAFAGKTTAEGAALGQTVLVFEANAEPKENLAMPFKAQTGEALPRIMGQKRDWLVANLTGDVDFEAGSTRGSSQ